MVGTALREPRLLPAPALTYRVHTSLSHRCAGVQTLNGETYNGEWSKGVRHGVGTCHYADGGVYEGEWFNDQRHGFGVFDYVRRSRPPSPLACS